MGRKRDAVNDGSVRACGKHGKTLAKSGTAQSMKQLHFSGKRKGTPYTNQTETSGPRGFWREHTSDHSVLKESSSAFHKGLFLKDKEKNKTQNHTTDFFSSGRANHDPCGEKESNLPAQGVHKQDRHSLC